MEIVDTLRLGGRISDLDTQAPGWRVSMETGEHGEIRERGRLIKLTDIGPTLNVVYGDEITAWVEGSVPKWATGVNYPAADLDLVHDVAKNWIELAGADVVTWDEQPRINRLDVVRDFDLGAEGNGVLLGHGRAPGFGRRTKAFYRDPSEHHAATVHVRTKRAGSGRLYDKHRESGLESATGVVRFEAQERVKSLRAAGVLGMDSLTSVDTVTDLGRSRFEWCGFDIPLIAWPQLQESVLNETTRWFSTRIRTLGYAAAITMGGAPSAPDRKQDWRLRRDLVEHGWPAVEGERSVRLDYDAGLLAA